MWIFLNNAFLSVVDKDDPTGSTLLVRARRSGDIEAAFPGAEVIEGAGTDYKFRTRIGREQVALAIADQIRGIGYGNFKGSVKDDDRHHAYMRVWDEMYSFQEGGRRRPRR
jgi:hypothetical protein